MLEEMNDSFTKLKKINLQEYASLQIRRMFFNASFDFDAIHEKNDMKVGEYLKFERE